MQADKSFSYDTAFTIASESHTANTFVAGASAFD